MYACVCVCVCTCMCAAAGEDGEGGEPVQLPDDIDPAELAAQQQLLAQYNGE